jgi:hypothetical protein
MSHLAYNATVKTIITDKCHTESRYGTSSNVKSCQSLFIFRKFFSSVCSLAAAAPTASSLGHRILKYNEQKYNEKIIHEGSLALQNNHATEVTELTLCFSM